MSSINSTTTSQSFEELDISSLMAGPLATPAQEVTPSKLKIVREIDKHFAAQGGTGDKAVFAQIITKELSIRAVVEFEQVLQQVFARLEAAAGTAYYDILESFAAQQIKLAGQMLHSVNAIAMVAVAREIIRSPYPAVKLSLIELIFGQREDK